jgi:signal transduction protein with GAF and PtsI domain
MPAAGTNLESSLLLTLEEISQLVSHSHHPAETLANIVQLIQGRFDTDVCSVYLFEPDQQVLVLGATVGLRPESVGQVRMRLDEGLTGLVAERLAPVVVDDAFQHPRFKYFPEAGEDPYHSFLGVPLVEGGALQGVLVVQTVEPRAFSPNETRMLVTVASQLASLVSGARLLDRALAEAHATPAAAKARSTSAVAESIRRTVATP